MIFFFRNLITFRKRCDRKTCDRVQTRCATRDFIHDQAVSYRGVYVVYRGEQSIHSSGPVERLDERWCCDRRGLEQPSGVMDFFSDCTSLHRVNRMRYKKALCLDNDCGQEKDPAHQKPSVDEIVKGDFR